MPRYGHIAPNLLLTSLNAHLHEFNHYWCFQMWSCFHVFIRNPNVFLSRMDMSDRRGNQEEKPPKKKNLLRQGNYHLSCCEKSKNGQMSREC